MKPHCPAQRTAAASTLIELVGVLCIITMLVAIVLPRFMSAIADAKVTAEITSINALRAATEQYFEQYGKFAGVGGAAVTFTNYAYEYWDRRVLFAEQFIDQILKSHVATAAYIRLVNVRSGTTTNTDILSAPGQLGHLASHNANNGLYNLTAQYAAATPPSWISTAYAAVSGVLSGSLLSAPGTGVGPMFACYSIPGSWTPPPPGFGGGSGGGSHTDQTSVNSQINYPATVAELVLEGITVADAFRLSMAIDGARQSNWAYWDSLGRVKYDMYGSGGGRFTGEVFIYLAHK